MLFTCGEVNMKYFRIKDNYDDSEVCIVKTDLTEEELKEKIEDMEGADIMTYDEIIENLGVEKIEISGEIYI